MSRQIQKKSKAEQLEIVLKFLNAGKTQAEAANAAGINIRTVQRWVTDPKVKAQLADIQEQTNAIIKCDPVVLGLTDIRLQVQEILNYRDSQRSFALEMGTVVQKATVILAKAVERIEQNPEEVTARNLPQLMRAVSETAERVSNAWAKTTGLDDLLEQIGNEPKAVESSEKED